MKDKRKLRKEQEGSEGIEVIEMNAIVGCQQYLLFSCDRELLIEDAYFGLRTLMHCQIPNAKRSQSAATLPLLLWISA
jgi:hypothetical protein